MSQRHVSFARRLRREQTYAEMKLWAHLRNEHVGGAKFRRQAPIGKYIVDFVSFEKNLVIELDGSQHAEATVIMADAERTKWLESQGFRVIRFWDNEVIQNLEGVFARIEEEIK